MPQNDPLSYGAPILPTGKGALEVGMARMGAEGKAKAAADKAKAKAKPKPLKLDVPMKDVWMTHSNGIGEDYDQFINDYSALAQARDTQGGDDPDRVGSKAYNEVQKKYAQLQRWISNSNQQKGYYDNARKEIETNPGAYPEDAGAQLNEMARTVDYKNPELINPLDQLYDLNKAIENTAGGIVAEKRGSSVMQPDGTVRTIETSWVPDEDVMAAVQLTMAQGGERATRTASEWYENLAANDPDGALAVQEYAKDNNISLDLATVYNMAVPVYKSRQTTVRQTARGAAGFGAMEKRAKAAEFVETGRGIMSGNVNDVKPATDDPEARKLMIAAAKGNKGVFDRFIKGGTGEYGVIEGAEIYTDYNDLTFTTIRNRQGKEEKSKVRGIVRDNANGKIAVMHATDDQFRKKAEDGIEVSDWMTDKDFYQKAMKPLVRNSTELKDAPIDAYSEETYGNIRGAEGRYDFQTQSKPRSAYTRPGAAKPTIEGF